MHIFSEKTPGHESRINKVNNKDQKSSFPDNRSHTVLQREQKSVLNRTGLPDNLKKGIETLSGYSMDDVKVHYNSSKPHSVQAHAYTRGTEIHIAPGQSRHLPHEAWHVVQQKQGRVKPTMQLGGLQINDSPSLENEADIMGKKAQNQ